MSARFYSPGIGAFTQLDSVMGGAQDPLSMNRFLYALANPATFIDPDGHAACAAWNEDCQYLRKSEARRSEAAKKRYWKRQVVRGRVAERKVEGRRPPAGVDGRAPRAVGPSGSSVLMSLGGAGLDFVARYMGIEADAIVQEGRRDAARVLERLAEPIALFKPKDIFEEVIARFVRPIELGVKRAIRSAAVHAEAAAIRATALAKATALKVMGRALGIAGTIVSAGFTFDEQMELDRANGVPEGLAAVRSSWKSATVTAATIGGSALGAALCSATGVGLLLAAGCAAVGGFASGIAAEVGANLFLDATAPEPPPGGPEIDSYPPGFVPYLGMG